MKHRITSCVDLDPEAIALSNLVDEFSYELKKLLLAHHKEGYSGWADQKEFSDHDIRVALHTHVLKVFDRQELNTLHGRDLLDVAAFAAFLWNRLED